MSGSCSTTRTVLPRSLSRREHRDEPLVVGRVEPDRRLVENVERVDEIRAEGVREIDALRLPSRERARETVEREVAEADVDHEPQARRELREDIPRDAPFLLGERRPRDRLENARAGIIRTRSRIVKSPILT